MKPAPSPYRLEKLRANLKHFENSPDFGDAEAVAVIRRHLLTRIREAESARRYSPYSQPQSQTEAA